MSFPNDEGLIAHWPFAGDCEERVCGDLVVRNHGVEPGGAEGRSGAAFNGRDAFIEVQDHPALRPGREDFSIACWIHTGADVVGDLVDKFDPGTRRGVRLGIVTHAGVTSTAQANRRHLHFGVDDRSRPEWTDCGRPGHAVLVAALIASAGRLYAGTLETGAEETGHLWRYEGGSEWTDLGNPVGCNIVHSVAEFDGEIYCGLGRYMCQGSALGETLNQKPGGQVYRVEEDGRWVFCGHPGAEDAVPEAVSTTGYASGKADDAFALTVFQGQLYCTSNHRRGAFVYAGGESWRHIGPDERIISFTVYRDRLYALINGGSVYRYEGGEEWVYCGRPETSTQTYGAVIHAGRLHVGTWPEGEVYRYEGEEEWSSLGRVGYEREIMGMALYNGKVYVGALPMANVWRLDREGFTFVDSLDAAAAPLRRVWSMAVHQGKLFAGTLPSGRVHALHAGRMATWDQVFPSGWHHVAAVREGEALRLHVDGELVAQAAGAGDFDLDNDRPLRVGFGEYELFSGLMNDLRLYGRALSRAEVGRLAGE